MSSVKKYRPIRAIVPILCFQSLLGAAGLAEQSAGTVSPGETQKLIAIIEEQQLRLDAQQAQLQQQQALLTQQRAVLQMLRAQVESLQPAVSKSSEGESAAMETVVSTPATSKPAKTESYAGLDKAVEAARQEWPGSFGLEGSDTRMKISGFAEFDILHDSNDVLTPTAFLTQAIRTSGPGKDDGQTSFSVQASRLSLETRTPLDGATVERPRQVHTPNGADERCF